MWCLFLTAPFHTLKIISACKVVVVVHWSSEECPASHFSLLKNFDRPSVFALHTHGSTKEFVRRRYIKQQDTSLNGRRGTLCPGDDADSSLSMGAFRTCGMEGEKNALCADVPMRLLYQWRAKLNRIWNVIIKLISESRLMFTTHHTTDRLQRIGPNALDLPPKFSRSLCKNKVRHLIVEDIVDVVSCTFSLSNGALYSFYDIVTEHIIALSIIQALCALWCCS